MKIRPTIGIVNPVAKAMLQERIDYKMNKGDLWHDEN